ncbi:NAD(P)/FAD-dependent oxidoreductase [Hymenobacter sp. BT186]|uniref:NADH:ubiquinone reductase (non-electrogenic) n=1 Tax=Hymenobacter telluris TaxID=2816474 RepID=A0A939J9A1_9BACT|nr:NAD(P)/FAD-dependent oxidoreductase [Hymenobacter telluris]MBO0356846.1 NAD(P)/FAD-dependent oxidoreductase [Hymenobacter telluris]MBW3372872.1 NAD(P)/FAD-dependent oxidoreductase [Hymenobacter norwichensis]
MEEQELAKIEHTGKQRVVIVGGGFGGLELAKSLRNVDVQVVLVDKQNYHTFQPLMYQVATAGLEAADIVSPFRKILEGQDNLSFRMAEVVCVNTETQVVETSIGLIPYDFLVVATGATTNYFGDEQMARHAIAIKSVEDAVALRNTVLSNFEKALQIGDDEQLNSLLDFVIVGGGPTGVEVAGALSELRKHVFPKDYREIDFRQMDIHLIQSGDVLLKGMSAEASQKALEYLQKFGVNVMLERRVKSYDGYTVTLNTGEKLITRTLIWAAGVAGAPIDGIRPESLRKGGRYEVNAHNQVAGYSNIFAVGDIAAMLSPEYPEGHPMVAQPAIQQGRLLASNLERLIRKQPLQPFHYDDKGAMATIGRNHAVADVKLLGKEWKTQGFFAWVMWALVHVIALVEFRNRLTVFANWMWNYFSQNTGLRYIMGGRREPIPTPKASEPAS